MQQVSDKTLREAQNHAVLIQQQAEQIRNLTNHFIQTGLLAEAQRSEIEQCRHLIQQSAQIILDAVEFAYQQPEHSIAAYGLAVEHDIQAYQQWVKAIRILVNAQKTVPLQDPSRIHLTTTFP